MENLILGVVAAGVGLREIKLGKGGQVRKGGIPFDDVVIVHHPQRKQRYRAPRFDQRCDIAEVGRSGLEIDTRLAPLECQTPLATTAHPVYRLYRQSQHVERQHHRHFQPGGRLHRELGWFVTQRSENVLRLLAEARLDVDYAAGRRRRDRRPLVVVVTDPRVTQHGRILCRCRCHQHLFSVGLGPGIELIGTGDRATAGHVIDHDSRLPRQRACKPVRHETCPDIRTAAHAEGDGPVQSAG
ncbi:GIY-YIG nuclease family protein [Salinicola halimionae]|uniref:GIY-YIG nuclease family protein n=1 Tax=Salinicola halimionae TaxID=1949081 RepID=UPI003CC9E97E